MPTAFEVELEQLINRYSKENDSNTPDWILAEYLNDCLYVFGQAIQARERWYGREFHYGRINTPPVEGIKVGSEPTHG